MIAIGVPLLLLGFGFAVLPPLTRRWTSRWGATDEEVEAPLPGDDLVPQPDSASTKAITIAAPADVVYRLVIQMGYRRGGWYGWDWFYDATGSSDFVGGRHATTIVPELQDLEVGDAVRINDMVSYDVVRLEPPTLVVLHRLNGADPSKRVDPANRGPVWSEESWVWAIRRIDSGHSRLLLRMRSASKGQSAFVNWLFANPLDFGGAVMGYKTLVGIKNAAEDLARN